MIAQKAACESLSSPTANCGQGAGYLNWIVTSSRMHLAILLILVIYCFARTLTSYFLADDFGQIAYVCHMFQKEPQLFWSNWTGNYMQVPSMNVYRPLFLVSMSLDWCLYGARAWGYFLTNLIIFSGNVIALYILVRALTINWGLRRSAAAAFFAAAIFAVYPLHSESVSWVVGRSDSLCSLFCLLSMIFLVKSISIEQKACTVYGVIFFALALLTKEMAITLPLLLSCIACLFFDQQNRSISEQFIAGVKQTLPWWITLLVYFVLRFIFLGTVLGGYTGEYGAADISDIVHRWLDTDILARLFCPLSSALSGDRQVVGGIKLAYILILFGVCGRLFISAVGRRWLALLAVWWLCAVAPVYKLWGLGPNLEGGRFFYFASIAIAVAIAVFVFHPDGAKRGLPELQAVSNKFTIVAVAGLCLLIHNFARAAYKNNMLWVHAGQEVRAIRDRCQTLAASDPIGKKFLLLGIPTNNEGAHMILNRFMFQWLLSPPFSGTDISTRFITTVPIIYGAEPPANGSRLRRFLREENVVGPLVWSRLEKTFTKRILSYPVSTDSLQYIPGISPIYGASLTRGPASPAGFSSPAGTHPMPLPFTNNKLSWQVQTLGHASLDVNSDTAELTGIQSDDGITCDGLSVNPLQYQYIQFEYRGDSSVMPEIKVYWQGAEAPIEKDEPDKCVASVSLDGKSTSEFSKQCIDLGHYWRWYALGKIKRLSIVPPPGKMCKIRNIVLLSYDMVAPTLRFAGNNGDDPYTLTACGPIVDLIANNPRSNTSDKLQIEISKPGFFFDNCDANTDAQYVGHLFTVQAGKITLPVINNAAAFPQSGFYQLRARCLDANGKPTGEYSDPVTITVTSTTGLASTK